ncbi:hypothetical protein [Niveispirillum sp.]|uniref:hypothetical protein n=1 Tax=Niveispirillum sp. TaxID=1917217 RepID=UPI001B5CFB8D|nr:hypothetical protein [Niveispirillum sp.]MBP7339277.1 hypothetical protein [Niveispirillum sp.]
MKAGGLAASILCLLAFPPAFAADPAVNTFKPLPGAQPLPGQVVSLDDADLRLREALPQPCTGRDQTGAKAGTWIGAAVGMMAGMALGNDSDSNVTTAAKGLAGAGVASTVGYLVGRAYDGPRDCPGLRNELPRVPFAPIADEVAWEERRRALAGGP